MVAENDDVVVKFFEVNHLKIIDKSLYVMHTRYVNEMPTGLLDRDLTGLTRFIYDTFPLIFRFLLS